MQMFRELLFSKHYVGFEYSLNIVKQVTFEKKKICCNIRCMNNVYVLMFENIIKDHITIFH